MTKIFKALVIFPTLAVAQLAIACSKPPVQASGDVTEDKLVRLTKPAVVQVVDGCQAEYVFNPPDYSIVYGKDEIATGKSGSGYFINPDGYIATSAHVVQLAIANQETPDKAKRDCEDQLFRALVARIAMDRGYAKDLTTESKINDWIESSPEQVDFFRRYSRLRSEIEFVSKVILPGKNSEPLSFQVRSHGTINDESKGADVAVIKVETRNAPALLLGDSDQVKYGDSVTALGYPAVTDTQSILQGKLSQPITVTPATVADQGKRQNDNASLLQLNLVGEEGRLGGPILNRDGEVIGMVTNQGSNLERESSDSSVSFATSASTIKPFIGEAGTTNQQGKAQEWYRQGLDYYYRGELKPAKLFFERVKANYPNHSEIDDLIVKSQELGSDPVYVRYLPLILGIVLLAGLSISTIAFLLPRLRSSNQSVSKSVVSDATATMKATAPDEVQAQNEPAAVIKPPFIELSHADQVLRFELGKDFYRIGRDPDWSDFEIPEIWDSLSRRHAILRKEGMDYRICDGDGEAPSKYGIYAHGTRIDSNEGYVLQNGAQLKVGFNQGNPILLSYFNPASARLAPAPTRLVVDE